MSRALHEHREELIALEALNNGHTRRCQIDVDGATGTRLGMPDKDANWVTPGGKSVANPKS